MRKYELLIFLFGILICIASIMLIMQRQRLPTPSSHLVINSYIEIQGKVTYIDLSPLTYDGDGIVDVWDSNQGKTFHVRISSGESSCDREALNRSDEELNKNSAVRVKGKLQTNDVVRICDKGTYIRIL